MWMSLMTSGVKMRERPRTVRRDGAVSSAFDTPSWWSRSAPRWDSAMGGLLEDELALGRLEVVVVVELLAADELLQLGRVAEPVDGELAGDELGVRVRPLAGYAVDAQRADLPADVDRAVVHRVAQPRADVPQDDLAAALHHEARHRAGVA